MSVSRGAFLKSLGKSLPGMILGGGVAGTAQKLLHKMAAASGEIMPAPPAPFSKAEFAVAQDDRPRFITEGPADGNRVALTFDDGPTPGVTDRILDALKQRQAHATFFMIGERIAAAPELARRVLAEGHDIGNHTFTHAKLTTLSEPHVEREIQRTQDTIRELLNHRAAWFRPPYGAFRQDQAHWAHERDMAVALWSVDSGDWSRPGEKQIVDKVVTDVKPGSIILCHDLHEQTAQALPELLDKLQGRGSSLVTLSELMAGRVSRRRQR
jgi:peptidoglycan/xylan/chitin deacetylase (PgdA/CDA1 family)